ncbi:MAG: tetratricopeptide repeat protein [Verrucomicrobiota bacterium]
MPNPQQQAKSLTPDEIEYVEFQKGLQAEFAQEDEIRRQWVDSVVTPATVNTFLQEFLPPKAASFWVRRGLWIAGALGLLGAFVAAVYHWSGNTKPAKPTPSSANAGLLASHPAPASTDELLAAAQEKFDQRKYREAIESLELALAFAPNDPRVPFELGKNFRFAGDLPKAIRFFSRTIELDPAAIQAVAARAEILKSMGRCEEAVRDFSNLVALNPGSSGALRQWAECEMSKDLEGAIARLQLAIAAAGQDHREYNWATFDLIECYLLQRNTNASKQAFASLQSEFFSKDEVDKAGLLRRRIGKTDDGAR